MSGTHGDLAAVMKALVEGLHPDLRKYFRPSVRGKVVAVDAEAYRVDVVVGEDSTGEVPGLALPAVPVASLFAQNGYGIWALPEVDAEVTISFHDGDPTQPYVESPMFYGNQAPSGFSTGTIAIRGKQGQKIEIKPDSNEIVIAAGSVKIISSSKRQEAIDGDQAVAVGGERSATVVAEKLNATSLTQTVSKAATLEAGSITQHSKGDLTQKVGGSVTQKVTGGISQQVAGGTDLTVTLSRREIVGGSYELLIAAAPGVAKPGIGYSVMCGPGGNIKFDSISGMISFGCDPLAPPAMVNVGSALPGVGLVHLGDTAAIGQGAVYGPVLLTLLTQLLAALKTSLQIGNAGAPTAPNPAFVALLVPIEAMLTTLLSTKVFVAAA